MSQGAQNLRFTLGQATLRALPGDPRINALQLIGLTSAFRGLCHSGCQQYDGYVNHHRRNEIHGIKAGKPSGNQKVVHKRTQQSASQKSSQTRCHRTRRQDAGTARNAHEMNPEQIVKIAVPHRKRRQRNRGRNIQEHEHKETCSQKRQSDLADKTNLVRSPIRKRREK